MRNVLVKESVIPTVTYNPASFVRGHVTIHLHTLAGVSVDVNGVDAAQRLSVQQVLGTILRCCKQTAPWGGGEGPVMICSFVFFALRLMQILPFGEISVKCVDTV